LSTVQELPSTPGAPEDELFAEFQAYIRSIYHAATEQTAKDLEQGVQAALAKLQSGIQAAVSGVQANADELARAVREAQEDFRQMFEPVFQDYQRRLIQDQLQFMDVLAGKLASVFREQQAQNNENLKVQAEQIVLSVQNRFDAMRNIVSEKTQAMQKSNENLQSAMSEFHQALMREVQDRLKQNIQETEAAARAMERANLEGWNKAVSANQQALDAQVSRLDKMAARMQGFMIGLAALSACILILVLLRGK
jgi:hypothetical protein